MASIPMIGFFVPFLLMFPTVFPMQLAHVREAHYADAPLFKVLQDISLQKDEDPYWRFHIEDKELAQSKITVNIPKGCRLGTALTLITGSAGCEMRWTWHKGCGNEWSPICASFYIYRPGCNEEKIWESKVMINQKNVYGIEENK